MRDAFGVEQGAISKGVKYLKLALPRGMAPTSRNLNRSQALGMRKATAAQGKKVKTQGLSVQAAKDAGKRAKANRLDFVRRNPNAGSPKDQMDIYGTTLRNPNRRRKLP